MRKSNKAATLALSVFLASAALSPTVFADKFLPELTDKTNVSVTKQGEKIELSNPLLVEHGEIYLPLRDFLNKTTAQNTDILWSNDRSVTLKSSYLENDEKIVNTTVKLSIDKNNCEITKEAADEKTVSVLSVKHSPLLIDSKTYISYELATLLDKEISITNGFELSVNTDSANTKQLEKALTWAEALKTRDGQPRYDMMTEGMQKAFIEDQKALINDGDNWNYVIGVSSPQTLAYDIFLADNNAYIIYYQTDSSGMRYAIGEKITFEQTGEEILVSSSETFGELSPTVANQ